MPIDIGQALGGIGAGLQGQLPQYMAAQQQQRTVDMAEKEQQQKLAQERMKTYFMDADASLKMLNQGNVEGVLMLNLQRLKLLQNFPDADPSDTQAITQLAVAAKNGSPQAMKLLKGELESAVNVGKAYGVIQTQKPATIPQSDISKQGQMVQIDPTTGQPKILDLAASGYRTETQDAKVPDSFQALKMRAEAAGMKEGTPAYAEFMKQGGPTKPEESKTYQEAADLRKEFSGIQVVKDFAQQSSAMGRIQNSATDPSPAGDLALIFNYMKMLDPGSTVREGEFANAQNAGGVGDRVVGLYNRILNGERLSESMRKDFLDRSNRIYKGAESSFMGTYNQFEKIAKRRKIPVEDALVDYRYKPEEKAAAPSPSVPEGATATNPSTGEKIVYRNGKWERL